jgi:hypothetical protein
MHTDVRGAVARRALERVAGHAPRTMAVVPEGVMLNYLARVPTPTRYVNFMPPEEILFGDDAWAAAFDDAPPDLVLSVPKDVSEYGRGPFGVGYGVALGGWIGGRYGLSEIVRVDGVPFEIGVLTRTPDATR